MVRVRTERRVATVLFVDIVDSTRIASDMGDRGWRELLGSFRRAVRRQLRRHGGHEQDTAGDGFFATFDRPAGAVRAASAIVGAAQSLGFDVRCGVHTGELERIDGRLGGIAAHIGARVMALAGPAEMLATGTVHDLVVGGGISFEQAEEAELKGVPGRWTLYRVTEVDHSPIAIPLGAEEATGRRGAPSHSQLRMLPRTRLVVLGVAGVGALSLAAVAAVIFTLPRDAPSLAGVPSPSGGRPPSLVRIDPETNEIAAEVHDAYLPVHTRDAMRLVIVDGTLWQETPINMVRRDLETGEVLHVIDAPPATVESFFGFGSLWFAALELSSLSDLILQRVDPLSGRTTATVRIDGRVSQITIGREAIYVLTPEAIIEIDPTNNQLVDRDEHGLRLPDAMVSVGEDLWICECQHGRIAQWDADSDTAVQTLELPQRGFILDDQRELSQGNVSVDEETVWLMDGGAGTLTPVNITTGEAGQPIGIPQGSSWHVFGFGSIWIAGTDEVYRVLLSTFQGSSISLPDDVFAGALAVDESTGAVWLANYVPFSEPVPRPPP